MGFMRTAPERPTVETVATASGKVTLLNSEAGTQVAHWPKARLWILADRTAVVVWSPDGKTVERTAHDVVASSHDRRARMMTVQTTAGLTITAPTGGCGCGMGVVGSAGPVEGPYKVVRIRTPDWHEVI